jgi:putative redox protein
MDERVIIARTEADSAPERYRIAITAGRHALISDEPAKRGGGDAGPAPYELLLSGLAACTAITLRMYAERKEWPLAGLHVDLRYLIQGGTPRIERSVIVQGSLDEAQRARLAEIAEKTPVTLTLKAGVAIHTEIRLAGAPS